MGTTTLPNRYEINGIIDTNNSVLDNLTTLCNASGCWLTYDNYAGAWSVIINRSGTSTYSFDDSNIIGPININGTGLYNLYNSVRVSFPHEDLRNQKSYVQIDIPAEDRFPNEPDNILQIDYPIVTNPVQAQLLGFIELKQSRVDKIVTFTTDFSVLGIKAGDIIDLTNDIYGFSSKLFRVITVREIDSSDNAIQLEITALEYSSDVYDESTLSRYTVTNENGIVAIGAIPAPSTPTVTAYDLVSNPRVSATTTVAGGIVEAVEFWYTTDVPPGVNDETLRTYKLLGTAKPLNSTLFEAGQTVTLEIPSLSAGEFLIKARCVNASAASTFSDPSGILTYQARQATDAITDETKTYDENGNLVTTAGLATLLALANEFFGGNAAVGPGGGSGAGSTFFLLDLKNFNSNSTTGGSSALAGSIFTPVVRIVPPASTQTRLIEGIDQTSLSQCLIGGEISSYGGFSLTGELAYGSAKTQTIPGPLVDDSFGWPNRLVNVPSTTIAGGGVTSTICWPQYYPHKIIQMIGYTQQNNQDAWLDGASHTYYGVDLNSYRYYYPDATELKVEIRGYWTIRDQVFSGAEMVSNVAPTDSDFNPTTVGSAPFHANAFVYTDATNLQPYDLTTGVGLVYLSNQYATLGIGASSNVTVSDYVYPTRLGTHNAHTSTGDHIATFVYDFTKPAVEAPSFDTSGLVSILNPIEETIDIPTAWSITNESSVITSVTPTANVTANCLLPHPGTIGSFFFSYNSGSGTYTWRKYSDTDWVTTTVPLTANVFSYDFMSENAMGVGDNPIWTGNDDANNFGSSEWWCVYPQYSTPIIATANATVNSSGYYTDDDFGVTTNLYKIQTTSLVSVVTDTFEYSATYFVNEKFHSDSVYVPLIWGQKRANVGNITVSNFANLAYYHNGWNLPSPGSWNTGGVVASTEFAPYYRDLLSYPCGFFYSDESTDTTHIEMTPTSDANLNVKHGLGVWVRPN